MLRPSKMNKFRLKSFFESPLVSQITAKNREFCNKLFITNVATGLQICDLHTLILRIFRNKFMQKNRESAKMKIKPLFGPPTIAPLLLATIALSI